MTVMINLFDELVLCKFSGNTCFDVCELSWMAREAKKPKVGQTIDYFDLSYESPTSSDLTVILVSGPHQRA